jgi:hypothetical protein
MMRLNREARQKLPRLALGILLCLLALGQAQSNPCHVDVSRALYGRCHARVAGYIFAGCP